MDLVEHPHASDTGHTRRFAKNILGIRYDKLPAEAVALSKDIILDFLGVAVAGSEEPLGVGRLVKQYIKSVGGNNEATVWTGGFKTSVANAAFANGTLGHALDYDNSWNPANHPTSPTLPAILAVAERDRASGRTVIEALVAALETQARARLATGVWPAGDGFHKPGITGTIGAVAGSAKMIGLNEDQLTMAFGIAGSRAGSLTANIGTMTKSSHSGHAARMGLESAELAKIGWTAHPDIFGTGKFYDDFIGDWKDLDKLHENFASPLYLMNPGIAFKKHPSNFHTHRSIDAALALREESKLDPSQIVSVDVTTTPIGYVNRPKPATGLDGKFSIQYVVAAALLDGEITVATYTNERRFAADMVSLLGRLQLHHSSEIPSLFEDTYVDLKVTLTGGKVLNKRLQVLTGWSGMPMPREQRLRKFHGCIKGIIDPELGNKIVEMVEQFEDLKDVSPLMELVR
jgi:aconitate decarboxylase